MGGSAINFELAGKTGIADATFKNVAIAIFALLEKFPMGELLSLLAMVIVTIFFITSADSATYVVGMMSSAEAETLQIPESVLGTFVQHHCGDAASGRWIKSRSDHLFCGLLPLYDPDGDHDLFFFKVPGGRISVIPHQITSMSCH